MALTTDTAESNTAESNAAKSNAAKADAAKSNAAKSNAVHEWMIVFLCLGLGGHVVFALLLHAPESWPADTLWLYGLVSALGVYVCVWLARAVWRMRRAARATASDAANTPAG